MALPKSAREVNRAGPEKAGQANTIQWRVLSSGTGSMGWYTVSVATRAMSNRIGGISPGPCSAPRCPAWMQLRSEAIRISCSSTPTTDQSPTVDSEQAGDGFSGGWPDTAKVRARMAEVSPRMSEEDACSLMQVAGKTWMNPGSPSSPHDLRRTGRLWCTKEQKSKSPDKVGTQRNSKEQSKQSARQEHRNHRGTTVGRTRKGPGQFTDDTNSLKELREHKNLEQENVDATHWYCHIDACIQVCRQQKSGTELWSAKKHPLFCWPCWVNYRKTWSRWWTKPPH